MKVGFYPWQGGFVVSYATSLGMQVLRDETGEPALFSKRNVYASNYGAAGREESEPRRVYDAMSSPAWDRI